MFATPAAALELQVDAASLSAAQARASTRFVDAAQAALPQALTQRFEMDLRLRWRDDLPGHVVGRAFGRELSLDRDLLDQWLVEDPDATQVPRPLLAALLHELTHALDRSAQGRWSSDPRFLDLAGWQVRPLLAGRGGNDFSRRSPDAYERHNPAEFLAVNAEHYLLDPDYHCRRPALAAWFAAAWGAPEHAPTVCSQQIPLVVADARDGGAQLQLLDPARIHQVDYLLAEGNEQLMSRWGHSMLRLVICAPGREPGAACRMDLQHHLVLSFRAFVGDVQISSWRGLTGSYPSRLFVLPLAQVVEEYTRVELRALSSTPLNLSQGEIAGLLERAAQLHWSYDGRYYFISNNCAVETYKLLHAGVPRLAPLPLSSVTPVGLQRRLQKQGVTQASAGAGEEAVRAGYYFPSAASQYQTLLQVIIGEAPIRPAVTTVEQWLALPARTRHQLQQPLGEKGLAAAMVLERAAQRRWELRLQELIKREVSRGRSGHPGLVQAVEQWLHHTSMLVSPSTMLDDGYGIPVGQEQARLAGQVQSLDVQGRAGWQQLREQLRQWIPVALLQEQEGIRGNLEMLGQRLKHHEGSGVP